MIVTEGVQHPTSTVGGKQQLDFKNEESFSDIL